MTQTATKREVKQTLEEVLEAANELRSQGMTGIVLVLDDGRYEILWAPAKLYPLRGPKTWSLQVRDTRGLLHRDAKRNIVNHRATPASLPI